MLRDCHVANDLIRWRKRFVAALMQVRIEPEKNALVEEERKEVSLSQFQFSQILQSAVTEAEDAKNAKDSEVDRNIANLKLKITRLKHSEDFETKQDQIQKEIDRAKQSIKQQTQMKAYQQRLF